jgi:membrane-bound lytic murein transglycosylase D
MLTTPPKTSTTTSVEPEPQAIAVSLPQPQSVSTDTTTSSAPAPAVTLPAAPDNVWERIRLGMALPAAQHPRIERELEWFKRNPEYMARVSDRAQNYLYYIAEEVERRNIPMEIALLPIVESAFQPFAYSHGRASGIWQFIPGTGRLYGLKINWWYDGRRDVYASTLAALDYLEKLHKDFNGDWMLALAAYNAGEGNVGKAIKRNRNANKPTDFFSLKLPKETRMYVPRLLAVAEIVKNAHRHNITLAPVPNQPHFEKVDINGQIDLALAAEMADIPLEDLYRLNPGFNRWATSPSGPHYLLLPVDMVDSFNEKLAALPEDKRMRWVRHRIKSGETIGGIARRYHTTVALLRKSNNLSGNTIRAGKYLTVPVASKRLTRYSLSADERRTAKQHTPRKGTKVIYLTRQGDTLWDIANSHGVSVRQLASWNGMAPRDTLRENQKLVIWTSTGKQVAAAGNRPRPSTQQAMQTVRYTVRKGDSLSRIAARFRVTIAQLRQWNGLSRVAYLQPGQKLKLLVDVTRQYGS